MDRQRFCEVLCHGLTLCIDEMSSELTAGRVAESERPSLAKCLAELTRHASQAPTGSGRPLDHYRSSVLVQP